MEKGLSRMTGKPLGLSSLKSGSGERNAVKAARGKGKRWLCSLVDMATHFTLENTKTTSNLFD